MNQKTLFGIIIAVAVIIVVLLLITPKSAHTNTQNNPTDANVAKINDPGYIQALNQLDNSDVNADLNSSGIVDIGQ